MTKEELEVLSYTDLTYLLLKENETALKTPDLFRQICGLLEYNDDDYAAKIGDYYTSLTTDKRFILLDGGMWDIRDRHSVEIVIDDEDEEEETEMDETDDEAENTEVEEDIDSVIDDDIIDDDIVDDEDLTVITEEEIEEDN